VRLRAYMLVPSILSAGNFYLTRVGWINCFIVIYCVFLFYMLIVLRHTGSRFKYFLYELFMLIYFAGIARRVIWSEYTYIYCTCAGCIIVIVCIFVSLCSAPSTVLPLSREPNLRRSVVIIRGARPQLSNFVWEIYPREVSRSWAPFIFWNIYPIWIIFLKKVIMFVKIAVRNHVKL